MPEHTEHQIARRKADHIRISLEENVDFPHLTTGLEHYHFQHTALPELNLDDIDTSLTLFGRKLRAPVLISSMTGGEVGGQRLNRTLAEAAQAAGIAMGLGSQRAAIQHEELANTFKVRDVAPDILLLANVGAVQLNYGFDTEHYRQAVEMAEADALILHFNALQEAVQPEGDINFAGLLAKVERLCKTIGVPVIAKEVGWGFSQKDAKQLADAGVAAIDVAGAGGTSWSQVESHRINIPYMAEAARTFADWGIPTAESIIQCKAGAPQLPLIASGGLRSGLDIAKCIALGAMMGGMAGPFLKAAARSVEETINVARRFEREIRVAMFMTGSANLTELQKTPLLRI
jgi:isopentenyl-diphosphate Delta-isomerase